LGWAKGQKSDAQRAEGGGVLGEGVVGVLSKSSVTSMSDFGPLALDVWLLVVHS